MRRWMGVAGVALVLAVSACATSPEPPQPPPKSVTSAGTWTYAFDAGPGLASATLSAADGLPIVRFACKAPDGALLVQDWTFSRARQNGYPATFTLGARSASFAGIVSGDGAGRQALSFQVPAHDAVFADLTPSSPVSTAAAGFTHVWAPGAASRLNDVLNSCHTAGS